MILETIYKYRVMKALNILSVLFFLLVATACSSESDTIMNDIDKEVEAASEVYASFGVSLAASDIQTRAGENTEAANENESMVKNCYIAVFEERGKLLGSKLYNGSDIEVSKKGYTLKKNIVFKVPANGERKDLTIVAVANISEPSIARIQNLSYSGLMDFTLTEDPGMLVKVGQLDIASGEYDSYMTISSSMYPEEVTPITIEVAQRSAAIELNELTITSSIGEVSNITVTAIQLKNKNFSTKVDGYVENYSDISAQNEKVTSENGELKNYRLYTYSNKSASQKTALYFEYSYNLNGKPETGKCTFTIKTPTDNGDVEKVVANHLYKLNVTITNGVATATIQCSTKDWNEGNEGETIVIPVKENK